MSILKTKKREPVKALSPAAAAREAEARLIMAKNEADLAAVQAQAQLDAEVRDAKAKEVRANLDQEAKAGRSKVWAETVQLWTARFVPFFPLVMVNTVAVYGQLGWGRENLDQIGNNPDDLARWAIALLFAATLESIALFLAYYANRALNRGDSATALYLGAFGMAAIVAMVNYSHYASPDEAEQITPFGLATVPGPTAMAVVCAMCSIASPWLWRIKHRDANRDRLHELGAIDAKAVRLGMASKLWHPYRSFMVMWYATWDRTTNPAEAVARYEAIVAAKRAVKETKAMEREVRKALEHAAKAPKATETDEELPAAPTAPAIAPAPVAAITAPPVAILPPEATKHSAAWDILHQTTMAGNPISQRQLAANYLNKNRHHAVAVITAYKKWKGMNQHAHGASHATP